MFAPQELGGNEHDSIGYMRGHADRLFIVRPDPVRARRLLGPDAGLFEVPDDFNAPLPEDLLDEFER